MVVNIWTGVSGTGKTERMFNEIYERTKNEPLGAQIYIITPTQNTLRYESIITGSNEKKVCCGNFRTAVFSFNRLIWHVYNEIGFSPTNQLSEHGHLMLLHKMMSENSEALKFYKKNATEVKFTNKVLDMIKELTTYSVSVEDLSNIEAKSTYIEEKMHDVSLIYHWYEKIIHKKNIESLNQIPAFLKVLNSDVHIPSLKDAVIYIDGFHNFTESEFELIVALERRVSEINVLLTHDKDHKSLFRKTDAVIERLRALIPERLNFSMFNDPMFQSNKRAETEGLRQLERFLIEGSEITSYEGIEFIEASSAYDEITAIAKRIEDLTHSGVKFKDIAITYRDPNYLPIIKTVFNRFNIHYHLDEKVQMNRHPFIKFIIGLINCYNNKFSKKAFLNVLKSDYLIRGSEETIDLLENILIEKGLEGDAIKDDKYFTKEARVNEDGELVEVDMSKKYKKIIQIKNEAYNKLSTLYKSWDDATIALDYLKALYNFLNDNGIIQTVEGEIDSLEENGDIEWMNETSQSYQLLIQLMNDAEIVFGNETITTEMFLHTFLEALKSSEFNLRPSTVDQIMVGSFDLAKVENKPYVFAIGMNREVMPKEQRNTDILSDEEKDAFLEAGIQLSPNAETLIQDERFVFYLGMTRATTKLFISYSNETPNGTTTKLSPYVQSFVTKSANYYFITHHYERFYPERVLSSFHSIKHDLYTKLKEIMLSRNVRPENLNEVAQFPEYGLYINMFKALKNSHLHEEYVKLINVLTDDYKALPMRRTTAKKLYGEEMQASVSRFESFQRCPFQHFSRYGLNLNVRKPYRVEPLELGNLAHEVLYYVTKSLNESFVHEDDMLKKEIDSAIKKVSQTLQFGIFNRNKMNEALKNRTREAVFTLIKFMRDFEKNGSYKVYTAELSFGPTDDRREYDIPGYQLMSENGHKIHIRGKIDRVDTYEHKGSTYLNVIDYKSSKRNIKRQRVLSGLELQMFTYMLVLIENGKDYFKSEQLRPNSMLYYQIKDYVLNNEKYKDVNDLLREEMRPYGNYIIEIDDRSETIGPAAVGFTQLLNHLEYQNYKDFIRVRVKIDDTLYSEDTSHILTVSLFEKYRKHIESVYKTTTDDMYNGVVDVSPIKETSNTPTFKDLPCNYCEFKHACHIDLQNHRKEIRELAYSEVEQEAFESEEL